MKTITSMLLFFIMALTACKKSTDELVQNISSPSTTHTINLRSELWGYKVNPPNSSDATGTLTGTLDLNTGMVEFKLNYNRMTPTEAHIHRAYYPDNGPIVYTIPINGSLLTGSFTVNKDDANAVANGGYYIDLHSRAFEPGEIRGQIEKVQ